MKIVFSTFALLAFFGASGLAFQPEGRFERTLNVSGPLELDVYTDAGGIVVTPGPPGSVHIRATLKASRGPWSSTAGVEERIRSIEANPPVQQSGNRVIVGQVSDKHLFDHISMRLEITTPPDSSLRARADSGGIRVSGIKGPADCKTDSGGIEAQEIGGEVKAQADSGGIRIRNTQGQVYARADSGGIEATGIAGAIDVQADSGGLRLGQTVAAPVHAKADSGGITLRLAPSGGYDIRAHTSSGHVSAPEMVVRGTMSRGHVEGKVRGGGAVVDLQADSGQIRIE